MTGAAIASAFRLSARGLAPSGCLLTAEQEQGPFYVGREVLRSSIAEGKPGVPLRLRIVLFNQATCRPLRNAAIDLWHCDAMGLYSGFTASNGFGPPPGSMRAPSGKEGEPGFDPSHGPPDGPPPDFDPSRKPGHLEADHHHGPPAPASTDKLTFLRGIQMTGPDGSVTYDTIFPGFYQGRVNHIHFKVRLEGHRSGNTYEAGHTAHVGQLFFPEDLSVHLMQQAPYSTHAIHRTTMDEDHVFNEQHGSIATVRPLDPAHPEAGFLGEYHAAVDPSAIPAAIEVRPG